MARHSRLNIGTRKNQDIAFLHFIQVDGRAIICLVAGTPAQADIKGIKHVLRKAGTIKTPGRLTSIAVRGAQVIHRITNNTIAQCFAIRLLAREAILHCEASLDVQAETQRQRQEPQGIRTHGLFSCFQNYSVE